MLNVSTLKSYSFNQAVDLLNSKLGYEPQADTAKMNPVVFQVTYSQGEIKYRGTVDVPQIFASPTTG